jgi:septum formation inhibitor MinC
MDSFEMSGTAADVTVLRLKTLDVSRIEAELRAHIASDPLRFLHAPVIVDVSEIGVDAMDLPLAD